MSKDGWASTWRSEERWFLMRAVGAALMMSVVAGCGSAGSSDRTTAPPTTTAESVASAAAINLKPSDLPGFTASPLPRSALAAGLGAQVRACAGTAYLRRGSVRFASAVFSRVRGGDRQKVRSVVRVLPRRRLAVREVRTDASAKFRRCLTTYTNRGLGRASNRRVTYGAATFSDLPLRPSVADASTGYRVSYSARAVSGAHARFYVDSLVFALGRYVVELTTEGLDRPFPSVEERQLYELLVRRAARSV